MKLLLDQNLSYRVVAAVIDLYPDSAHISEFGLQRSDDSAVWAFAAAHGFTIVSKGEDFHQRSFLYGYPPKVVWLRLGNCSTDRVIQLLRCRASDLGAFEADLGAAFLVLS